MELFKFKKKLIVLILTVIPHFISSQTKGIILDVESYLPVPYVNIHTTNGDGVLGTTSDRNGKFNIDFSFESLSFSHIGYEKISFSYDQLTDTVFLLSKSNQLQEIVVYNRQEEWIDRILRKVIDMKAQKYGTNKKSFFYKYNTYTLNDSNGYAFNSEGLLIVPKLRNNATFYIDAQENVIQYKDTTAGVDFSNMQRMLYQDFITTLDLKFIREHDIKQNHSYAIDNPNVVQLMFRSQKYEEDEGHIVVDTASYVILKVERKSGTDFNIDNNTSTFLRGVASSMKGFKYEEWITKNRTTYSEIDGSYYMTQNQYKFYMKSSIENRKVNKQYFTSIESELKIDEIEYPVFEKFIALPKPYYILLVRTKKMREEEDLLNQIPVRYSKF